MPTSGTSSAARRTVASTRVTPVGGWLPQMKQPVASIQILGCLSVIPAFISAVLNETEYVRFSVLVAGRKDGP